MSDAYDMIARFLRNNLGDDDYADFSAALDSLCCNTPAVRGGAERCGAGCGEIQVAA